VYLYGERYEPTVYLYGESGRNCQVRLGVPSLAGGQLVPRKSEMVTHRDVPSPVHPWEMRLYFRFLEIEMAKSNLSSMSVDALLKLRDDVGTALSRRADELKNQLSRLGGEIGHTKRGRRASLKGRKVPVKYRDGSGNTWAGRGAHPVWLREKLKAGAKLEDFAVRKTVASRKVSPRKSKKRRRAKR
jgi:DNA-binding protein H-NS